MYGLLHYPGDVTDLAVPGRVLGESAFRIPYEVTESEYVPFLGQTTVHLKHASAETMRNLMALREQLTANMTDGAVYVAPAGTPPPSPYPVSKPRQRGKSRR